MFFFILAKNLDFVSGMLLKWAQQSIMYATLHVDKVLFYDVIWDGTMPKNYKCFIWPQVTQALW